MSQRKIVFPKSDHCRDVIVVGWAHPLSQLFMFVGTEYFDPEFTYWDLDDTLLIDTYIDVLPKDISPDCLYQFGELIRDGHRVLDQPMCSDVLLERLLSRLRQDALEPTKSHSSPVVFSIGGSRRTVH